MIAIPADNCFDINPQRITEHLTRGAHPLKIGAAILPSSPCGL